MVTNRLYPAAALSGAILLGCSERPSPLAPAPVLRVIAPASAPSAFSSGLTNPCNGEFVEIEGWIQLRFDVRTDAQGGTHTVGRILEHGDGTGLSTGAAYVFSADTILTGNAETIQFGSSQSVIVSLLGQGQAPNFLGLQVLHFTVNSTGQLVGVVDAFRSECR